MVELHGHTHIPYLLQLDSDGAPVKRYADQAIYPKDGQTYPLGKRLTLCNPGSVGQSRVGITPARYAVLDTIKRQITFFKVSYSVNEIIKMMSRSRYPSKLIKRLHMALLPNGTYQPTSEWQEKMKNG